ncbi:hypothetical protein PR002_g24738 [Phytophthora rubi]|uniref:Uncharacterized protein n=1 Tax=Phytophthora rubi TaxID=129364 RepID=A0A6A3IEZ3_9STRA|nr:hypothetical protein PR002_g24738 [Phytophthora rubi]
MAGKVEMKTPPSSMDFQVNSLQALVDLLSKQQMEQQPQNKLLAVAEIEFGTEARVEKESDQTSNADLAANLSRQKGTSHGKSMHQDAEGFYTKESKKSKAAKGKAAMPNVEDSLSDEADTNGTVDVTVPNSTASLKPVSTPTEAKGKVIKSKPVPNHRTESKGKRQNGKMHRNPAKRFEQFQRHEALGQFGVLADTDSDEGDSDDMDVDDEAARYESPTSGIGQDDAPYAFPATQDASMAVEVGQTAAPAHAVDAPMTTVEPMEGVEDGDQTTHRDKVKKGKARGNQKHSRRPKQAATGAGLPKGALKGMQTSMANYMHHASATVAYAKTDEEVTAAGTKNSTESDVIIPDTPDSQEDLSIGDTRSGNDAGDNDLPIQIGQWLQSFQGSERKPLN